MRVALYRKLLRRGYRQINILGTTETNGIISGMSYSYSDDDYAGLFTFGDTISDVKNKAARIYIKNYMNRNK